MQSVRRLITIDDEHGRSKAIADGPSPDVRTDAARPGFSTTRIWVTDRTPARIDGIRDTLDAPHTLEPPPGGSVCRIVSFPPDAAWRTKVSAKDVERYFESMGSPGASRHSPGGPHPYLQNTGSLDFCLVLSGRITLVLDAGEVDLSAGDTVVLRGGNHAWSNRSDAPCVVAFSSHDAHEGSD